MIFGIFVSVSAFL